MILLAYGLPGSGRKTFINNLKNYFAVDDYYDFEEKEIKKSKETIKVLTLFTPRHIMEYYLSYIDKMTDKIFALLFPTVFERKVDEKYSEFLGIDIRLVYEKKLFETEEYHKIGPLKIHTYDYNFDNFKFEMDTFLSSPFDLDNELTQNLKGQKELLSKINLPSFNMTM